MADEQVQAADTATQSTQVSVNLDGLKAGIRSTEFWLTLVAIVLSGCVALGILSSETADGIWKSVSAAVAAIGSIAAAVIYGGNRTKLKMME